MSYGLFLSFVKQPMLTEGEALKYASDLVKQIALTPELANERITECKQILVARLQNIGFHGSDKEALLNTVGLNTTLDAAMHDIFSMRFVYWPQHQLLATVGEFPASLSNQVTAIYFQNSTDPAYPYEDWSDEIPLFKKEKDSVISLPMEDFIKEIPWERDPDEKEIEEWERQSVLYYRIFDQLKLDNYLYRQPEENGFTTFRVSGLGNAYHQAEIRSRMRAIIYKEMEIDPLFWL